MKIKYNGITLVELMLVLVIIISIVLMFFNQYQVYQKDRYYRTLQYDVDLLLQGMKSYYRENCGLTNSRLAPTSNLAAVAISSSELTPYLPVNWPVYTPVIAVDTNEDLKNSFYTQFNPGSSTPTLPERNAYVCFKFGASPECTAPQAIPKTQIFLWQIQVVVKMANSKEAIKYLGLIGADCAAEDFDGTEVVNCKNNENLTEANYLVWQRLPSFATGTIDSIHWMSNPVVKQFKLQYTNDPMYELSNPDAKGVYQNYLCGG